MDTKTELDYFAEEAVDEKIDCKYQDCQFEVTAGTDTLNVKLTRNDVVTEGTLKFNNCWYFSLAPAVGVGEGQTIKSALACFVDYL